MSLLAAGALAALLVLAGSRWRGLLASRNQELPFRLALYALAGLAGLFVGLLLLDAIGVRWRVLPILGVLGLAAALARLAARGAGPLPPALPLRPGWGDAVAAAVLLAYAVFAVKLWIVNPDFVYHWGIKGHRFYLAGGVDYAFLAAPWRTLMHPEYPNLLPALFAATATLAGAWREPAMMLWAAGCLAVLLAAARQVLRQAGASPFATQSTLAAVALTAAMFGIGYLTAGSPDVLLALVPLAAWPALAAAPDRAGDLQVGIVAAVAAGGKLEGVPLAAILCGVYLWRRDGSGRRRFRRPAAVTRALLPPALVAAPWLLQGLRHGLFAARQAGPFEVERAPHIARALVDMARTPEWHGVILVLGLLPLLLVPRATRAVAAVCSLQLLVYLWIYFTFPLPAPAEISGFLASNFPRLAFHLVPAVLVAAGLVADRWSRGLGLRQARETGSGLAAG